MLSRDEQIREIVRCGKNATYFIKTYVKIQHPLRGVIKFDTYEFQDSCVKQFQDQRLNIVLKSRQLGLSTVCAAYAVWMAIFQKDKNILVIATKLATAANFIKKVQVALTSLPKWLLLPTFEAAKQHVQFSNGSMIKAIPTSSDAGRSEALSLLIIDEAAFIRDFDEIWTGLAPTLTTGGRAIVLSTPNGVGGQYHKLWVDAVAGLNGFNPIKIMWYEHPDHDQEWFEKETRSLSKKKISQEYMCSFVSSGDTFLQAEELERLRAAIKEPLERVGDKRDIWVWAKPEVGHRYVISADVARGDANDYSTFHIIDLDCNEVVVEYMGKTPPEKLADLIFEWGQKYNDALAIPENNTFGYFVNVRLRDLGYKRLYYKSSKGDPYNYVPVDQDELPGFHTDQKNRVQILTKLEELIRTGVLRIYSHRACDQLQQFIWNGSKPMAIKGGYDDLVMSLAIGCWLLEGSTGKTNHQAMAVAMLQATKVESRELDYQSLGVGPPSMFTTGRANQLNPTAPTNPQSSNRSPSQFDFRWLLR